MHTLLQRKRQLRKQKKMNPKRKTRWAKEHKQGCKCQAKRRTVHKHTIHTKLQKRNRYHFHPETDHNKPNTIGAHGLRKPARRKQLQGGLPPGKLMCGNKVVYDPGEKLWQCVIFPKTLQENPTGGIILHACRHTKVRQKQNAPTWNQLNKTQLLLRNCR